MDTFYNADVALVDLSVQVQQSSLLYHLGVRESFDMKENVLLYNDVDPDATLRLKVIFSTLLLGTAFLYNKKGIWQQSTKLAMSRMAGFEHFSKDNAVFRLADYSITNSSRKSTNYYKSER